MMNRKRNKQRGRKGGEGKKEGDENANVADFVSAVGQKQCNRSGPENSTSTRNAQFWAAGHMHALQSPMVKIIKLSHPAACRIAHAHTNTQENIIKALA